MLFSCPLRPLKGTIVHPGRLNLNDEIF